MKILLFASAVVMLSLGSVGNAEASGVMQRTRMVDVSFRLDVSGKPAGETTFWVAYGPLNGRFGIIRLRHLRSSVYGVTAQLPRGHTIVSYLQGQGTVKTRTGLEPGNPIVTIKVISSSLAPGHVLPVVHWQMPVG